MVLIEERPMVDEPSGSRDGTDPAADRLKYERDDLARRLAALPETVRAEIVAMLKTGGVRK